MKIERLELRAFGCFSNVSQDFSCAEHGFFVLYGANEAGKSIALEGIRQWLYEIDRNVPLDFRHKKGKQRVGGIVSANGQRLCCFRKRGNADNLVDETDKPINSDALRPFLQGIDVGRFRSIFGIDHVRLREGGKEIAAGKGDLGQALFAAGSGLMRLDRILKRLEEAKGELFGVRGEKPAINGCLIRCKEIEQRLSNERLSLAEIKHSDETVADLHRQRDELNKHLSTLQQKYNDVERLIRVTPLVERRRGLLAQLGPIRGAIRLRHDFRTDFQKIDRDLLVERQSLEDLQGQLKECNAELGRIASDPEVLREKDTLQKLLKMAGTYETDNKDLPGLQKERNLIQGEAKQKLRALGREPSLEPENIEPLRCDEPMQNRIRNLGTHRAEHFTNSENARKQVDKLALDLRSTEADLRQLPTPANTEGLSATFRRITKKGDLENAVEEARQKLAERDRSLTNELSRLGLWTGTPEQVLGVPVPSAQDIDHHRDQLEAAEGSVENAVTRLSEHRDRLTTLDLQLERLRHAGEVPSEQELEAGRFRRQHGWRLIRSAWLDGKRDEMAEHGWIASLAPEASLAEAYEIAVTRSDQTADRLRREATRVSDQAGLLAEQHATRQKLEATEEERNQAKEILRAARDAWTAIWKPAGIEPRSPKEMRPWLDQWQTLVQRTKEWQIERDRFELKKHELQDAYSELQSAFMSSGGSNGSLRPSPSLSELLELTERRINEAKDLRQTRATLEATASRLTRQEADARHELVEAERHKAEWEQQWDAALDFLEPEQRLSPDEANRVLDIILEFWKKINDLKNRQGRIDGIESRSGGFPQSVADLAERLEGKRPESEDPLRVHERFQTRLQEAESNEKRRREEEAEGKDLQRKIDEKNQSIQVLQQQLKRLCQEAHVNDANEIPETIRCSDEKRDLETKLEQCEGDVQLQGGIADLEMLYQLAEDAEKENRDCGMEKSAIAQEIEDQRAALESLNNQIGAARDANRWLRERSGAGESQADLESEYARLTAPCRRIRALVIASHALNEAIRRYRAGNSTGLLAEASHLFSLLTCGSFERLAISEEDEGKPYLIGVRPDGSEVGVEGMSDGTCDQLYLALRLAHLKRHAEKEGPFPFIVDDILLTFDDDRSRAALRCLADLGRYMQVLLFTHHSRLRDQAEEAEFSDQILIRYLSDAPRAG